jgi:hypothetical protein
MPTCEHLRCHKHEYNLAHNCHLVCYNHFQKQLIDCNFPMAVCVIYGTKLFGFSIGISPIKAVGCAPTGLK